ncbi:hypothetical protein SNE40_003255 [Patella caerulea]|uniref:Uncharacterized protein n=1 Tax=Patella caerulea TaxID=87958 RepID=A0AAN8K7H2_PATCE
MDKAMRSDLTELEAKLVESQEVLETTGKFGKAVPVIIPNDTVKLIGFLANGAIRRDAGINEKNIYLFPNSVMGVLRPYDSLKTLCGEWSLQKPEQMTSVNLRKYTATISQVFDLSPQEQSWLVNHLGHSMDIHKIHYRQTSSAIERIDIAKMMLIHECNLSGKYAGQKLSEIDLNEIRDAADGKIQLSVEEELNEGAPAADTELTTVIDDEGYTPGIYNRDELDVFLFVDDNTTSSKQTKRSTGVTRVSWTTDEIQEIMKYFKKDIEAVKTPGKKECKAAMEKSKRNKGTIHRRNWETLKKKVWNIIQKKK